MVKVVLFFEECLYFLDLCLIYFIVMNYKPGVYSLATKSKWVTIEPKYSAKELLIKNYQVMQSWEDNYMKSLAALTTSLGGNTLEVGFGMGISCGYILKSKKIKSHTVVECHPGMVQRAKEMYSRDIKSGRLKIKHGFWEDVCPKLTPKSFDGIFFDSCPLDSGVEFFQFFPFFKEAFRLLKDNGVFTYFSDEARTISKEHKIKLLNAGFKNISFKLCKVHPPKICEYWKHNTIVVPLVKKNFKD